MHFQVIAIWLCCLMLFAVGNHHKRNKGVNFSSICERAKMTGIFKQKLDNRTIDVRCDVHSNLGNWLVIQRRISGNVNFFRGWTHYVHGFGDLNDEFWLGLDNIYKLTNAGRFELQVRLANNKTRALGTFSQFKIADASTNYMLEILGELKGSIGDSLHYHVRQPFSTYDRDNMKENKTENCALTYFGAWWYNKCFFSNLNSRYSSKHIPEDERDGYIIWTTYMPHEPVIFSEMMLRPATNIIWDDNFDVPTKGGTNVKRRRSG